MRGRAPGPACLQARAWPARWAWSALLLLCATLPKAGAQANPSPLLLPAALAYDGAGDLFIADSNRNQILEATVGGKLVVVAGTGIQGYNGDGGPATGAELNEPQGVVVGSDGTLYIADTGNQRIRAIAAGVITTYAGSGTATFADGAAAAASFRMPTSLTIDASGALLVCDTGNHRVRRVSGGVVTTLAGDGVQGFGGDGGPAAQAELDSPGGIAAGSDGRVYIADTHNHRVRAVASNGTISTFAGTGQRGFGGDGGPATNAALAVPHGLALTPDGLLIGDAENQRLRLVDAAGTMTTLAGAGTEGTSADGTTALQAPLRAPRAVAVTPAGLAVVSDALNRTVRVLTGAGALFQPAALVGNRSSALQSAWGAAQVYGQASASVLVSGAVGVPQGAVKLVENGITQGSGVLRNGTATISLSGLSAGAHTLMAAYAGDGLNPAATGISSAITISPAPVTVSATPVLIPYGAATPAFSGTLSGVLPQDSGQVAAAFSTTAGPTSPVGAYPITAALTGPASGNYALSVAPDSGQLQITPAASTIALSGVPQSYAGLPLRLSAHVASTTSGRPTGTVQFIDGGAVIASANVVNGSASTIYLSPPAGMLALTAQYGGDANFQPSTSAAQIAAINALPDFTVGVSGPVSATVVSGDVASYNVLVSAQPAPFTGDVTFSAAGLPPGASVSFSPVQVVPGASGATVTVSVQTAAATALLAHPRGPAMAAAGAFAAITLLGLWAGKTRRRLVLMFAASVLLCGCGARTVGEGASGLTSKPYTIVITGTSTSLVGSVLVRSTSVNLVVQN